MSDALASFLLKFAISSTSAILIFLAGRFWKALLKPWIENAWYQGLRLAPFYEGEFTFAGEIGHDFIELKQKATRIWGTMTYAKGGQGIYHFDGTVVDGVVRGTYEGSRLKPQVRGCFLLIAIPGKRELQGWYVEPNKDGTVHASEYKWTPKSS